MCYLKIVSSSLCLWDLIQFQGIELGSVPFHDIRMKILQIKLPFTIEIILNRKEAGRQGLPCPNLCINSNSSNIEQMAMMASVSAFAIVRIELRERGILPCRFLSLSSVEATAAGRASLTVCDLKVLTPPVQSAAGGVLDKRLCLPPSSSSSTSNNGSLLEDFKFLHTFSERCIFSNPEVNWIRDVASEYLNRERPARSAVYSLYSLKTLPHKTIKCQQKPL